MAIKSIKEKCTDMLQLLMGIAFVIAVFSFIGVVVLAWAVGVAIGFFALCAVIAFLLIRWLGKYLTKKIKDLIGKKDD